MVNVDGLPLLAIGMSGKSACEVTCLADRSRLVLNLLFVQRMLVTVNCQESEGSPKAFSPLLEAHKPMNWLFLSTFPSEMPVLAGFIIPLAIGICYTNRSCQVHRKFSEINFTIHLPMLAADR